MTALPPLPDHRAAALHAMDRLGAVEGANGVLIGTVADAAGLDAGQAWLAVNQLAHGGFVASHEPGPPIHDRRGRGLFWLTEEGRAAAAAASPSSKFAADRDRITNDEAFQAACQRYAHGNGSSAAIAAAALAVMVPAP